MNRYVVVAALLLSLVPAGSFAADPDPETLAAVSRLAVLRRDAARRTYEVKWLNYRERRASEDALYLWSVRWLEAEKQLSDQPADQVAAVKAHYDRMRELDRLIRKLQAAGQTTIDEVSAAEFYRIEAEVWLLQARARKNR
jgi:hypothetical protein